MYEMLGWGNEKLLSAEKGEENKEDNGNHSDANAPTSRWMMYEGGKSLFWNRFSYKLT